jgi:hypothetical protein
MNGIEREPMRCTVERRSCQSATALILTGSPTPEADCQQRVNVQDSGRKGVTTDAPAAGQPVRSPCLFSFHLPLHGFSDERAGEQRILKPSPSLPGRAPPRECGPVVWDMPGGLILPRSPPEGGLWAMIDPLVDVSLSPSMCR